MADGLRESSCSIVDGLITISTDAIMDRKPAVVQLSGGHLQQNFILTRVNMTSFAAKSHKWLKDRDIAAVGSTEIVQADLPPAKHSTYSSPRPPKYTRPSKVAPNYFVAIQVTDSKIREACIEAQRQLLDVGGKHLAPALIKPPKFHLTLMVMHLPSGQKGILVSHGRDPKIGVAGGQDSLCAVDSDEAEVPETIASLGNVLPAVPGAADLNRAKEALDECAKRLLAEQPSSQAKFTVRGVGTFNGQVIYAAVEGSSWLKAVLDTVSEEFLHVGIRSTDKRPTTPHLTLMKLSQARGLKAKGFKRFDPEMLSGMADTFFGVQTVKCLQLCAMHSSRKQASGYYQVEHEAALS